MGVDKYACFMQMYSYLHKTMTDIVQKPSQVLHLA